MLESIIDILLSLPPLGVFACTFVIAWVENLFPPSPSDVLLVLIGTLIGLGSLDFVPVLAVATAGSVSGFATAYWLGRRFGPAIVESPWVPFLDAALMEKVEHWFDRWHGLIIVVNRFLAGTRAVIAFAAGVVRLPAIRTFVYCAVSAGLWNALLLVAGQQLGANWRSIEGTLSTYGWVVTGLLVVLVGVWFYRKRRRSA